MAADGVVPDVRDGLTPGSRRALWALGTDAQQRSAAQVVDAVLRLDRRDGRRRAIYGELVRMARPWELRHPLVDADGDLGSLGGDEPASADYTRMRLAATGRELVGEADPGSAPPAVLPARFPNLLVNGSFCVATGTASSFPAHNLREVAAAAIAFVEDPQIGVDGLLSHITGPDFPTGAIVASDGLREAYETGSGEISLRARTHVEPGTHGGDAIVVTELPFMVATGGRRGLLAEIARCARSGRTAGIAGIEDRSDEREGLRLVVELTRAASADAVLGQLFAHTRLQTTRRLQLVARVAGAERTLTLRDAVGRYVEHRCAVVARQAELPSDRVLEIVKQDLRDVADRYGDERRTEIC